MTLAAIIARHLGEVVPTVPDMPRQTGTPDIQAARPVPGDPAVPAQNNNGERLALEVLRDRLLTRAANERLPMALIHAIPDEELAEWELLPDHTLQACLRALDASLDIAAGRVPESFTVASCCPLCGPVWLSARLHPLALTCPWCFLRRAGKTIPRIRLRENPTSGVNKLAGRLPRHGGCSTGPRTTEGRARVKLNQPGRTPSAGLVQSSLGSSADVVVIGGVRAPSALCFSGGQLNARSSRSC